MSPPFGISEREIGGLCEEPLVLERLLGHLPRDELRLDTNYNWWDEIERRIRNGQGMMLASAYLQGHVDAGRREWRDAVLDQWVLKGSEMASAVLDAVWRGLPDDDDVQRLLTLMQRHDLPPENLRILVWGGQTKHFSTEAFRALLARMLDSESEAANAGALELIEQRLGFYPNEADSLESFAWRALERNNIPSKRDDVMMEYRWNELARRYLPKNPIRVARIVLSLLESDSAPLLRENRTVQTLVEATHLAPSAVWSEVASQLRSKGRGGTRLHVCLKGWYAQEVGEEVLLTWAEQHQPEGPRLVAALTPVGSAPLNPLARKLLIHFGSDKYVASALHANFGTGYVFTGSLSGHLESLLDTARKWLNDPHPAIRKWAQYEIESLEQQLAHAKQFEEEEAILA